MDSSNADRVTHDDGKSVFDWPSTLEAVSLVMMSDTGPRRTPRSELTLAVTRGRLFVASYAPLFLILAIRCDGMGLRVTCGAVFVLGTLDALQILFRSKRGLLPYPITVHSVE